MGVPVEWLKLGTTWNGHVEGFGCEEALLVEQVEVVLVNEVTEELVGQSVQISHHW